jgi:hypothetical protein
MDSKETNACGEPQTQTLQTLADTLAQTQIQASALVKALALAHHSALLMVEPQTQAQTLAHTQALAQALTQTLTLAHDQAEVALVEAKKAQTTQTQTEALKHTVAELQELALIAKGGRQMQQRLKQKECQEQV